MSIQINNINAIDDDRNFSAAGIVTVGTGNSATIIDGTTGITSVGIGITMEGVPGNILIAGTLTAAGFNIPASIVSFSPANGATNVALTTSIVLTFSQVVGTGTTGYVYLRKGSPGGTTIQTFGVDDVTFTNATTLTITQTSSSGYSTDIYAVIEEGFIQSTSGNFAGLNTTGADSYSFTTQEFPALGAAGEGGYIICKSGGTAWIVAPSSAEVSRTWNGLNDANTRAQQVSGCTGWFVPSCGQLKNPGYTCRTYWDSYTNCCYWTSTAINSNHAWLMRFHTGTTNSLYKLNTVCVRAFRCVSY